MSSTALINPYAFAAVDPSWSSVVLLLGMEGSDGSTTFTDESSHAHGNATVNGDAQVDTAIALIGTSSLLLDGTGDSISYANHADWNMGSVWTFEGFWRYSESNSRDIVGMEWVGGGFPAWFLAKNSGGSYRFVGFASGAIDWDINTAGSLWTTGTRYHIAGSSDGSKVRLFQDGTMIGSATPSVFTLTGSGKLFIGNSGFNGPMGGSIDEIRLTKGICRYGSDGGFTPPTDAFPRS